MNSTRHAPLALLACAGLLLSACSSDPGRPSQRTSTRNATEVATLPETMSVHPLTFAWVVISVADMDQALGLWVDRFGMEIVTRRDGRDAALAKAWGVAADDIIDQALLRTPGQREGGVHLVRFRLPGSAVREGAASTDLVPKSVDIAVRDIQARYDELAAAGYKFRSTVGKLVTETGLVVHEVHMPAHDGLNLVFVEQEGHPEPTSSKGYGVAPQIVVISPDNLRESSFLQSLLGVEQISHNRFGGPSIEKTIGLPSGAKLDIRIMGDAKIDYGRIEIVQYEGATSRNLYPRAKAPARGMLSVTYFVPELTSVLARAGTLGVTDLGIVDGVYGPGHLATATTPAGLRIDLFEPSGGSR
jgi:catechol 2,3-dioxygenase-like lactoylglutathione lyase family enzyme